MICSCPRCGQLRETTEEEACSPLRDDRLCPGCYRIERREVAADDRRAAAKDEAAERRAGR